MIVLLDITMKENKEPKKLFKYLWVVEVWFNTKIYEILEAEKLAQVFIHVPISH